MNSARKCLGISVAMFFLLIPLAGADLQDGLVMYLPFDAGQGDVAVDLSGNGHDGSIEGAKWVEGKFGKALSFNGTDTFVEVPFADDFVTSQPSV